MTEVYCVFLLEGNVEEPHRVVDSTGGQLPLKSIALCHAPRQAIHRTHMRQPICNKNKKKIAVKASLAKKAQQKQQ